MIRLLRDEAHANPVVKMNLDFKEEKLETTLHFMKPIKKLYNAYRKNLTGQTVPILKSFQTCCVPITPPHDQALMKTFEVAAKSIPQPRDEHVAVVREMIPRLWEGRIRVRFTKQSILLKQL